MAKITKAKLSKLAKDSTAKGLHQLAVAASIAAENTEHLDSQINLVGAMHEVGKLRNSMQPYWNEWRSESTEWLKRCVERLLSCDSDYWALAAILGCESKNCINELENLGFTSASFVSSKRFDSPDVHTEIFSRSTSERVWAPVFEIGYDSNSLEVVDCCRWRAVIWDEVSDYKGSFVGVGSGSYYMRSTLPHGMWRIVNENMAIKAEDVIPR